MIFLIVLLVIIFALVAWLVGIYNGLVRLRNQVKDAWAQIDVQLKRRFDLIPNLVETVKGYMVHERETLEAVTQARAAAAGARSIGERAEAESGLTAALGRLFAVSEAYPDLKANQNFLALQEELTSTENKISFARQFYNDSVMGFNNKIQMFPSNIVAAMFNFRESEFFELKDEAQREAPKVSFGGAGQEQAPPAEPGQTPQS
jgi:LemA protein